MFVSILLQAFAMKGEDLSVYFSNPVGMVKGWITRSRIQRYFENGIPGISWRRERRTGRLMERFSVYVCSRYRLFFFPPTSCQLSFPPLLYIHYIDSSANSSILSCFWLTISRAKRKRLFQFLNCRYY